MHMKHDMVPTPKELTVYLGHQDINAHRLANDKDDEVHDGNPGEGRDTLLFEMPPEKPRTGAPAQARQGLHDQTEREGDCGWGVVWANTRVESRGARGKLGLNLSEEKVGGQ